ncbi:hypothetical protein JW960_04815 [candidate division KSB1 bacterium]|nr:hypothetical protein [candidate division KSB1 bacterium]
MVDINLLGDEKPDQDSTESSEGYTDSYGPDTNDDLGPSQDYGDADLDETLYGAYTQTSSKKAVFIGTGIIVVAAIAVGAYYFLVMKKGKPAAKPPVVTEQPQTQPQQTPQQAQQPAITQQAPQQQQQTPQTSTNVSQPATQTPPPPPPVADNVPPHIRSIVVSNQQGVRTIEAILSTIPQNVKATLIQYRDGDFLIDVHGSSSSNLGAMNSRFQQSIPNGSVKMVSQESRQLQGREYQQALFQGSISSGASGRISAPSFVSVDQVRSAFKSSCSQVGLSLKEFDVKREISTSQFVKTPILFKAIGTKDAALNFLNAIIQQNMNVNLAKIVFTTPVRDLNDQSVNLILNLEIYQPTL